MELERGEIVGRKWEERREGKLFGMENKRKIVVEMKKK